MAISTEKAYEILNLPLGSSKDAIEQSYKKLAVKWHPEKYSTPKNTHEALKKFKTINIAYRKLIHNERDEKDITLHEMFEQYRQVFHNNENSTKKSSLNEMNNNNSCFNNKNNHTFGNELPVNLINKNGINNAWASTKTRFINDRNNNNEENCENNNNRVSLKREDQSEQYLTLIKSKAKALAIKGNDLAKQNEFQKAIEKYTEAIKMDPSDHRLYVNRSYCYDKLNYFQEALNDADRALTLDPTWPKSYFRRGRALFGLKSYKEAEEAYEKVLEIGNVDDPELEEELRKIRILRLQEMGISKSQAENAIKQCGTVPAALESIFLYSGSEKSNESCSDIDNNDLDYYNDNDSENSVDQFRIANVKIKTIKSSNNSSESSINKIDSFWTSTSLWVGNVDPELSETALTELFSSFGRLTNIRCLPEKYCAFVNFKNKDDAAKAMQSLQGKLIEGQRLLIKYPDNPNTTMLSSLVDKKLNVKQNEPVVVAKKVSVVAEKSKKKVEVEAAKQSGPVNGNECYFWRTTGCLYGDKCHYEHIKKNKGIDKKPWHK